MNRCHATVRCRVDGSPCERIGPPLDILAGSDRRFSFSEEDTFVLSVSPLYPNYLYSY
jgi:hypothetical protein